MCNIKAGDQLYQLPYSLSGKTLDVYVVDRVTAKMLFVRYVDIDGKLSKRTNNWLKSQFNVGYFATEKEALCKHAEKCLRSMETHERALVVIKQSFKQVIELISLLP